MCYRDISCGSILCKTGCLSNVIALKQRFDRWIGSDSLEISKSVLSFAKSSWTHISFESLHEEMKL